MLYAAGGGGADGKVDVVARCLLAAPVSPRAALGDLSLCTNTACGVCGLVGLVILESSRVVVLSVTNTTRPVRLAGWSLTVSDVSSAVSDVAVSVTCVTILRIEYRICKG